MDLSKGVISLHGKISLVHKRGDRVLSRETVDNTVTDVGKAEVAGLLNEATSGGFKWLAIGSSSTAATVSDTHLAAEHTSGGLGRAAATCTRVTTDVTDDTAQLVNTFTATGTYTVKEAGIFDTSTADTVILLGRQTFTAKNMEANDTLQTTYKVDVD